MVRVVSQNFSPPRSRHSSGETDRDLAERANVALSVLGRKRVDMPEYESSSDSFWDSELDGDQCDTPMSGNGNASNDINGNETPEKSDVQSKRKERRRERNKLSAQAYRQRRRTQSVKEQQTLMELEAENKRLHRLVETLEKKTEHAKHMLRGCPLPMVEVLQPIGELDGAAADMSDTDLDLANPRTVIPNTSQLHASCSSHGPVNLALHSDPNPILPPPTFVNKPTYTSVINDPSRQIPILAKSNDPNFTHSAPNQPSPTLCPAPPPNHYIINTNVLVGATLSPSGAANLTVPTYIAVPVENQKQCYPTSNLNCNPPRTYHPGTHSTTNAPTYSESEIGHTNSTGDSSSVFNAVWWNGSHMKPSGNPVAGTIVSLVSMELCNNNSVNSNNGDANGNNSCDKNVSMPCHPNSQPVSFNLNLNQAAGATGQEVLCQEPFQVKHPVVSFQYFLAPGDQVSVQ